MKRFSTSVVILVSPSHLRYGTPPHSSLPLFFPAARCAWRAKWSHHRKGTISSQAEILFWNIRHFSIDFNDSRLLGSSDKWSLGRGLLWKRIFLWSEMTPYDAGDKRQKWVKGQEKQKQKSQRHQHLER